MRLQSEKGFDTLCGSNVVVKNRGTILNPAGINEWPCYSPGFTSLCCCNCFALDLVSLTVPPSSSDGTDLTVAQTFCLQIATPCQAPDSEDGFQVCQWEWQSMDMTESVVLMTSFDIATALMTATLVLTFDEGTASYTSDNFTCRGADNFIATEFSAGMPTTVSIRQAPCVGSCASSSSSSSGSSSSMGECGECIYAPVAGTIISHTVTDEGSYSYNSPGNGAMLVVVNAAGGGGGGGGTLAGGQGGGGGGQSSGLFAVHTGDTFSGSLGTGGTGGSSGTDGTTGGDSTATGPGAVTITAMGGVGGQASGGAGGGTGGSGNLSSGQNGANASGTSGGKGGDGANNGGSGGSGGFPGGNGSDASDFGGGGGGAGSLHGGGAGFDGQITFTFTPFTWVYSSDDCTEVCGTCATVDDAFYALHGYPISSDHTLGIDCGGS